MWLPPGRDVLLGVALDVSQPSGLAADQVGVPAGEGEEGICPRR